MQHYVEKHHRIYSMLQVSDSLTTFICLASISAPHNFNRFNWGNACLCTLHTIILHVLYHTNIDRCTVSCTRSITETMRLN